MIILDAFRKAIERFRRLTTGYAFRKFKSRFFFVLCFIAVIIAIVPLLSILFEVIVRGAPQISLGFLTENWLSGGIGPAIQGTLILIGLTSAVGIPVGILSGVFLAEFGTNKYAAAMRTINDVLTEFPSIVVGITVSSILVSGIVIGYSPFAGAVALAFILIPIVARTTEESLKLVPNSVREASLAMGVHRWRTIVSVVLPSARSGLVTGTLLAIARIAGETAPLLFTILGNTYFISGLSGPMDALPLRIFRDAQLPDPRIQAQAWGAALVLILMVLILNIAVRLASRSRMKR